MALLARETDRGLEYAGGAFITLSADERERFRPAVKALATDAAPLRPQGQRSAFCVRPELRVREKFLKGKKMLRHATLCGLIG